MPAQAQEAQLDTPFQKRYDSRSAHIPQINQVNPKRNNLPPPLFPNVSQEQQEIFRVPELERVARIVDVIRFSVDLSTCL